MKVLLISPPGSDIFAKTGAQLPPLGLAYLAAVARQDGHPVEILDMSVEAVWLNTEYFHRFDVVGITVDTPRYFMAVNIAKIAKKAGVYVVMGGYHATFMDKEVLETGVVDFVVRGEGEEIFSRLLAALEHGTLSKDLSKIDGISYLKNGKYTRNKTAPLPSDIESFPLPARDLLKLDFYDNRLNEIPFANLITSRGCPFDCFFCSSTRFGGRKWRYRSAKSIVDEMEILYHQYGYRAFAFMDDNFTISKQRIMDFADELEARNMTDIIWWCFSRVDILVAHEDMIKRMAEVGAYMIFVGFESANDKMLDDYGKNISLEQQLKAVQLLRKYGIKIHGSFIMGNVHENEDEINKTMDLAFKINPESLQLSIITPFPGTRLYEQMVKENRILHKNWSLYDGFHAIIRSDYLQPKTIEKILFKNYKRFYLRPGRVFNHSSTKNAVGQYNPYKKKRITLGRIFRPFVFYKVIRRQIKNGDTEKSIAQNHRSNSHLAKHEA